MKEMHPTHLLGLKDTHFLKETECKPKLVCLQEKSTGCL